MNLIRNERTKKTNVEHTNRKTSEISKKGKKDMREERKRKRRKKKERERESNRGGLSEPLGIHKRLRGKNKQIGSLASL